MTDLKPGHLVKNRSFYYILSLYVRRTRLTKGEAGVQVLCGMIDYEIDGCCEHQDSNQRPPGCVSQKYITTPPLDKTHNRCDVLTCKIKFRSAKHSHK